MTRSDDVAKLNSLIKDIDIAMMTTIEPDGSLRSRPMSTQQSESDGDLWFFSYHNTAKVDELERDRRVNLSYSSGDKNTWISVSGTANVVHDRAKMDELWSPILKAWFPDGVEDPNLALLKVEVEQAEYWDTASGKVVQMVGFVKALVTGNEFNPGDNVKLDLSHG